jgi:hypothetical protein
MNPIGIDCQGLYARRIANKFMSALFDDSHDFPHISLMAEQSLIMIDPAE